MCLLFLDMWRILHLKTILNENENANELQIKRISLQFNPFEFIEFV